MKSINFKPIFYIAITSLLLLSCGDYLDQSPESNIKSSDAFVDFVSFQGFTEGLYAQIVDISKVLTNEYNIADETLSNQTTQYSYYFDSGDYKAWFNPGVYGGYFGNPGSTNNEVSNAQYTFGTKSPIRKGTWPNSWYGIRKANVGLANLEKFVNGTPYEIKVIKGQLLFFRAYFYFTLMRDWGGLPYIEKPLSPDEDLKYPRLNYRETALKAAKDFEEAVELLPVNWDNESYGRKTLGNNRFRINKIMALAFLGKNYLYAASPLMNYVSTGINGYDIDLCKKAANAFIRVIKLSNESGMYKLQPWSSYSDMFYVVSPDKKVSGGIETIFNAPVYDQNRAQYHTWGLQQIGVASQTSSVCANYVKNWGMANGLPISDPESGYNPNDPWVGRDPRFYKTIITDGTKICNSTNAGAHQYAQLYTGGLHRNSNSNVTGFMTCKYWNTICNKFDNGWASGKYQSMPPILRLSDVYLMYAESVLYGFGSPQSGVEGEMSALKAVNDLRARAGVPPIAAKFTNDNNLFMDQIIAERAVELSFEGHRWNDLRRWLKNSDPKFIEKTELIFSRSTNGKPQNLQERLLVKRIVGNEHNWLPFPLNQVSLYPEFGQNPGW
jgi:hypothetical protein